MTKFCECCGRKMDTDYRGKRFCEACSTARNRERNREYKRKMRKRQREERDAEPKKQKVKKKPKLSISAVVSLADQAGMTYGEYVKKMGL